MKKINSKGFTIVEVMIVLAIAGLILAVVFVAVPALQRNQRNSARRNDVAYLKTAFTTTVSNLGNQIPSASQFGSALKSDEMNYISSITTNLVSTVALPSAAAINAQNICEAAGLFYNAHAPPNANKCSSADGGNAFAQASATQVCAGLNGNLAGTNCSNIEVLYYMPSTTASVQRTLADTGNSAMIVTKAQCGGLVHSLTIDTDTGSSNVNLPAYAQQSAIFFRLEGDDNVYCENI